MVNEQRDKKFMGKVKLYIVADFTGNFPSVLKQEKLKCHQFYRGRQSKVNDLIA